MTLTLALGRHPKENVMRLPALLAAAILVASTGIAAAQSQTPMQQQRQGAPATSGQNTGSQTDPRGTGMTGAPSSTNPQAGGGAAGNRLRARFPSRAERPIQRCRVQGDSLFSGHPTSLVARP